MNREQEDKKEELSACENQGIVRSQADNFTDWCNHVMSSLLRLEKPISFARNGSD